MTVATLALLFALLVQSAIALVLLWVLGSVRLPLIAAGKVHVGAIAVSRQGWPENERKFSNAFDNQFQLPVLFYVFCLVAVYLGPTWFEAGLAWVFVLSRIVHAAIHVTSNHVVHRFTAYAIGMGLLVIFWLDIAARLFIIALGGV